ncbi:MAG TPA: hypothetical protein VKS82_07945 [Streptosporangiaceae bacterium]|nr:hypothetical protein [Streptosporangiaceae bacterium]
MTGARRDGTAARDGCVHAETNGRPGGGPQAVDSPLTSAAIFLVSRAVTGNLFFVPSADLLEGLADGEAEAPAADGSLNIGSLRGVSQDE